MTYVIAEPCVDVKDKSCIEECPVDCIYEGGRMLYIQPDECVDCGACEPVCPVEAIYYEDDLPEQWAECTRVNAEFFTEAGLTRRGREDRRAGCGPPGRRGAARAVRVTRLRAIPDRRRWSRKP
jgi:ferredoxin